LWTPNSLKIKNFLSYGEAELALPAAAGPVLLAGKVGSSENSNGAGKTALFDSVLWVLFGKTSRGVKADEVVRRGSEDGCTVTLQGTKDGKAFEVTRFRATEDGNGLNFTVEGADARGATIPETQANIESFLKTTFDLTLATSMFIPSASESFLGAGDAKQKALLESLLDLTKFEEGGLRVRGDIATCKKNIAALEIKIAATYNQREDSIHSGWGALGKIRNMREHGIETSKIREAASKTGIRETQTQLDMLDGERLKEEARTHIATISTSTSTVKALRRQLDDGQDKNCPTCKQLVQAGVVEEGTEARIKEEETKAQRAHKMLELLRKNLDDHRSLTTVMRGYENNLKEAQMDIATYEARVEEQNDVLKEARASSRTHLGTMQDLKAKLVDEEAELVLLEQAKKALSVKGIRAYVIDAILPVVNSKLKHYARRLTSGEMDIEMTSTTTGSSGKVTNKLDTKVHKDGRSVSYSSLSAGERKRVDICALLALLDVLIVNGKASGLLVLDELFDALDSAGIEAAVALIHELPHDNIFVVSHNSELKSLFNYVITIEKEDDGSRIVL